MLAPRFGEGVCQYYPENSPWNKDIGNPESRRILSISSQGNRKANFETQISIRLRRISQSWSYSFFTLTSSFLLEGKWNDAVGVKPLRTN
ncbi:hypothetical protein Tco_0573975 [Tanacetum coccineum]